MRSNKGAQTCSCNCLCRNWRINGCDLLFFTPTRDSTAGDPVHANVAVALPWKVPLFTPSCERSLNRERLTPPRNSLFTQSVGLSFSPAVSSKPSSNAKYVGKNEETTISQRDLKGIRVRLGNSWSKQKLASRPDGTSPFNQIQQISHLSVPAMALFAFMIIISCLCRNDSGNKAQLSSVEHLSLPLVYCAQVPGPVGLLNA